MDTFGLKLYLKNRDKFIPMSPFFVSARIEKKIYEKNSELQLSITFENGLCRKTFNLRNIVNQIEKTIFVKCFYSSLQIIFYENLRNSILLYSRVWVFIVSLYWMH